jgi:hypothetical protein
MQKLKHNKKRNIGLLYEFFTRFIGKAILENRDNDIVKAKTLLKKHLNRGTDLYKELKLFKVLSEANVSNREQALHLINRVREAVKYQSQARLELEKTSLIHEVNSNLNADLFFEESITDYKKLGVIQVLLNTWRDETLKESVVGETVYLEEKLIEFMTNNKSKDDSQQALQMTTEDVDRLVVNLMTEKVNKKYSNLNEEQKDVIRLYVFSKDDTQVKESLVEKLSGIKNKFLAVLPAHRHEFENDKVLIDKLSEVKNTLLKEYSDFSSVNDDMVGFYLGLSKLEHEVKSK